MRKLLAVLLLTLALTQVGLLTGTSISWAADDPGSVEMNGGGWPGGK